MNQKQIVLKAIMNFLRITYQCYKSTNYTEDRIAFQSDIALCAKWLLELEEDKNINLIIENVMDASTSKHICDYYKQGEFGNMQTAAFENLRSEMRKITF